MKKITVLFTLFISITCFNCSEKIKKNVLLIQELKTNISKTYNTEHVEVKLSTSDNNSILKISLEDSKFNDYSSKEKQSMANDIGTMALKYKDSLHQITQGELTFIDKTNYGLVKTSNSDSYNMY